jgi:hypothetical protein
MSFGSIGDIIRKFTGEENDKGEQSISKGATFSFSLPLSR